MNDNEVRAELERINPGYALCWDDELAHVKKYKEDLSEEGEMFRLLAESQQALGEIAGLLQHQLDNEEPDDLITILQLLDALMIIARKHWKGGK